MYSLLAGVGGGKVVSSEEPVKHSVHVESCIPVLEIIQGLIGEVAVFVQLIPDFRSGRKLSLPVDHFEGSSQRGLEMRFRVHAARFVQSQCNKRRYNDANAQANRTHSCSPRDVSPLRQVKEQDPALGRSKEIPLSPLEHASPSVSRVWQKKRHLSIEPISGKPEPVMR